MPRVAKEMSSIEVKRLSHPGQGGNNMIAVGGVAGLQLQITPNNAKSWILRTMVGGRRRNIGLGGYPTVSLAMARERAREAIEDIRHGVDPIEKRKAVRASLAAQQKRGLTFAQATDRYLAVKLGEFRNDKHAAQWRSTLETYARPKIGDMLVSDINVNDIQRTLEPIWNTKTETASRLRGRIESVLAWSTVAGHRAGDNPARWKGNLDAILPKPGKITKSGNHPALALDDAARWFEALRRREGAGARTLEFLALTAARSGEVRGATWDEIDMDAALWIVPADRMKAEREHRIPLTKAAVAILRALPRFKDNPLVFPAPRGGQLSDMTLSAVMKRMHEAEEKAGRPGFLDPRSKRPAVPHGIRSTFRDWAAERTEYPRDMAEISLAHSVGSEVERAYRRGDMIEKRRAMMAAWGRFLRDEKTGRIVQLPRAL